MSGILSGAKMVVYDIQVLTGGWLNQWHLVQSIPPIILSSLGNISSLSVNLPEISPSFEHWNVRQEPSKCCATNRAGGQCMWEMFSVQQRAFMYLRICRKTWKHIFH